MCGLFVWPFPVAGARREEPGARSQDPDPEPGKEQSLVFRTKLGFSKMERTNKRHSHMRQRHERQKQQRSKVAAGIYG